MEIPVDSSRFEASNFISCRLNPTLDTLGSIAKQTAAQTALGNAPLLPGTDAATQLGPSAWDMHIHIITIQYNIYYVMTYIYSTSSYSTSTNVMTSTCRSAFDMCQGT